MRKYNEAVCDFKEVMGPSLCQDGHSMHHVTMERLKNSLYEPGPRLMSTHRKIKIYKHHFKTLVLSWRERRSCQRNIKLEQISCNYYLWP